MGPIMKALRDLGCEIQFHESEDHFPFTLISHGFGADNISINIDHSSQFLSAFLIASCLSKECMSIEVTGTHGMSYIGMTVKMMEQFGVKAHCDTTPPVYHIPGGQSYQALDYQIEPDLSAACYFYAAAALLGMSVTVSHVTRDSLQGDIRFLDLLVQMGCTLTDTPEGLCITGPAEKRLKGIEADMASFSDQAITLAALAPFADSPTTITGIGHIRHQESDRIHAIVTELGKIGIKCDETENSITIYPGTPFPTEIDTYDDHRMAMGFALIGLRAEGITIKDPG